MEEIEKKVLRKVQVELPLTEKPFEEIGKALGISSEEVISIIKKSLEDGKIRKIGAVLNPNKLGYETMLLAVKVPEDELEWVAQKISSYHGVTHNYLRTAYEKNGEKKEQNYNLWFTLIERKERFFDVVSEIRKLGYDVKMLPKSKVFKIGVKFDI
ncbi:MAG: Lrp/AsnC family transcriptional regulator [Candidatus Methanofastidiosia archaeon]